jgi:site-specific DNA recombinase
MRSRREQRCPAPYCPAFELEALVWADLCEVLQRPELIAEAIERARNGAWLPEGLQQQRTRLQTARASLARQQERLLDAYLAGALNLTTFDQRRQALTARDRELDDRERDLCSQSQRLVETQRLTESMLQVCARLRQGLAHATFEQRRELVELLIDRVIVVGEQVEIRYAVPIAEQGLTTRFCQLR